MAIKQEDDWNVRQIYKRWLSETWNEVVVGNTTSKCAWNSKNWNYIERDDIIGKCAKHSDNFVQCIDLKSLEIDWEFGFNSNRQCEKLSR